MRILKYEDLPQGGFAGLRERQFVMDSRLFKNKNTTAFNGIGNFVYLADANFMPHGETGMHSHMEIDVISIMITGRINHEGSLKHGQTVIAGQVQVQRAGGEGFSHNEINPDDIENHMLQLWVMPDKPGKSVGYKMYTLDTSNTTLIYGGAQAQNETFDSETLIEVAMLKSGQSVSYKKDVMAYLSQGQGEINNEKITAHTLIRSQQGIEFTAESNSQLLIIYEN